MQNPLGPYGNLVAAIIAVVAVVAAIASHLFGGLTPSPWLDTFGTLAGGVVFGTQVVQNGTQSKAVAALYQAAAANRRMDAAGVPPAPPVPGAPPVDLAGTH